MIAYGTTVSDTWPRMPTLTDKILKGAKPGEIAVEVISRRDMVINLKTAREIGVDIPIDVQRRADRLIQ